MAATSFDASDYAREILGAGGDELTQEYYDSCRGIAPPDLALFSAPKADPTHRAVLVRLVKLDLDYRWRSGQPLGLESYLAAWPALAADEARVGDLLATECLWRRPTWPLLHGKNYCDVFPFRQPGWTWRISSGGRQQLAGYAVFSARRGFF